jgi:hypothetical protein
LGVSAYLVTNSILGGSVLGLFKASPDRALKTSRTPADNAETHLDHNQMWRRTEGNFRLDNRRPASVNHHVNTGVLQNMENRIRLLENPSAPQAICKEIFAKFRNTMRGNDF